MTPRKRKGDKLKIGDSFKLDTIKPSTRIYTIINITTTSEDTSVIHVHYDTDNPERYITCGKKENFIIKF